MVMGVMLGLFMVLSATSAAWAQSALRSDTLRSIMVLDVMLGLIMVLSAISAGCIYIS